MTDIVQTPDSALAVAERDGDRPVASARSMIVFEDVTKIYEPNVHALRDVSFVIDKGEFVFVVGASGSGKSTVVRLLLKELEPTQGRIFVGGRDLGRLSAAQGAAAAPQRGLRVPGLQAAAQPHDLRERRLRAQGAGREPLGDPEQGARGARASSGSRTR